MTAHLIRGDARSLPLKDGSVQLVVCSPPFWGLRSYGGQVSLWGGDPDCEHVWAEQIRALQNGGSGTASAKQISNHGTQLAKHPWTQALCSLCGCWRGELGSEPRVQDFIAHLVEVCREVRRVMRDDAVFFLNMGDSYGGSGKGPTGKNGLGDQSKRQGFHDQQSAGRPKSLALVPERLAIALSDDGWIVRSRIAWCKAAPMPESVRDRPSTAWEHIFMLTKQAKYFWDAEAVREPNTEGTLARHGKGPEAPHHNRSMENEAAVVPGVNRLHCGTLNINGIAKTNGRNLWNYWVLPPDPYPGAHFATYPRELVRRCVNAASREGDVVLDPFSGSGTTAYVAASLGRVGVGVELSAEYIAQARYGRLAQEFLPLPAPSPAAARLGVEVGETA